MQREESDYSLMTDSTVKADENPPGSPPELKRAIGPGLLLFFVIGDILGTGIYALTGSVAGQIGGALWLRHWLRKRSASVRPCFPSRS